MTHPACSCCKSKQAAAATEDLHVFIRQATVALQPLQLNGQAET